MSALELILGAFHFLRPLWLLALPFIGVLWWLIRRAEKRGAALPDGLAPHLRDALTDGAGQGARLRPVDGVAAVLVLLSLGAAGPTWSRRPDSFVAQSAPVVVALRVAPSMTETDLAPSRLERGKQKIRDFLDLRVGARSALIAYAGTAHAVVPMIEDPSMMRPFLEGLDPGIMPEQGNAAAAALALAADILAREPAPGGVLFVADTLDPADAAALAAPDGPPLAILAMLPQGRRDRGFDALPDGAVVVATPDDGDLRRIDRVLGAAYRRAMLENADQPWEDRGWWLGWPAAVLTLLWFRRGWTMRWGTLALALSLQPLDTARAEGWIDWFLMPDQQGRLAYERRNYAEAGTLFVDLLWRGYALYRAGGYDAAVEVLARVETAEAAFIQGLAHLKSRGYHEGVRAFETALTRDPDHPDAAENLAAAREIVAYVERVREQSDTGERGGIGADDVLLDNEANRGAETQMDAPAESEGGGPLTAQEWMNTVDTRTGDFLRQRFAIEAVRGGRASLSQETLE